MKLYGYWRSSSTYRVRIVLRLKGLPFETEVINLRGADQRDEAFMGKSPFGQVPLLEVEDGVTRHLTQSVAICEWIEERHPEPPLLPADGYDRAKVRELVQAVNAGIQPLQNLRILVRLEKEHGVARGPWGKLAIEEGLTAYEALARPVAGRFSFGDAPTLADAFLVPQLYNARRFGIDVEAAFPLLHAIDQAAAGHPAFLAAHPDRQPDTPASS